MSTLINLLPDLRQAKLRELHRRQLVTGVAIGVWVTCAAIVGIMLVVSTGQLALINIATKSIAQKQDSLRSVDSLIDAFTAQQHLASLPALYSQRVYLSKFFTAFTEAAPVGMSVTSLNIDASNTLTLHGNATTYGETAKLARALSESNVLVGTGAAPTNAPYFTNVTVTNVDFSEKTGVGFTVSATMATGVVSGK